MTEPSSRLRWGLVSTAKINRAVIGPIHNAARSDLVGIASRNAGRAISYAFDYGIRKSYGAYETMLNDPAIDAVYISLPNSLHAEWAIKAAQAGKHVLCEKPIVPTLAELDQVEAAANENGVTIFEAFMYLHHPQLLRAQEMIREGKLGRVQLIDSWFSFYLPPEQSQNIRLRPELSGGALWDVGVYPTSMAVTIGGGLPEEVWAQQIIGETGVDVTMIAQLKFPEPEGFAGPVAQISSGFRMPFRAGTIIIGDEASISFPQPWKPSMNGEDSNLLFTPRQGEPETITIPGINPYLCEIQAMEACVLDGADPIVPLSRSRDILRTVLAIYQSAKTGRPVQP
ncbi:MAG: Gfo/Idh/MocA family oxidoreductase [Anaerolineae bacterium]|nr:Gfo/Idh/MocA family oxidoreductase [Anaerolineae bacterium]